ncbi:MAG: NAD-dependent epimerase/dehydratase family protein [Crocinitomicaceae bacterium]|nr:NAD-dependent epimerase/dehydratase family protein [Crocinitomicaceae bacterium]MBK8927182.1 NAD-dependent epimerase/dehydratase family protein [Crocinitomicaceae bacterium]
MGNRIEILNNPYLCSMILVTGATGLLGTHVLAELTSRGQAVRALKRPTSDLSALQSVFNYYFKENAPDKLNLIEWIDGDILDISSLQKAIQGCDVVYHCAALVSFRKKDFNRLIKNNKEGTANVVNVCLTAGVSHLCYVSSTATIGKTPNKSVLDENCKFISSSENSGYAVSKYLAEIEVWRGIEEGLPAVIINPSVILGPGNWNESSVTIFRKIRDGLKFYTPGSNAFVDARDVAYILCELSDKKIFNERYLVIGENLSYQNLFNQIAAAFQVKSPSICAKPWMAAIYWRFEAFLSFILRKKPTITRETARSAMASVFYSNAKICQQLNFKFRSMDDTISNAVCYFKKGHIYHQ